MKVPVSIFVAVLLGGAPLVLAQSSTTGALAGTVRDGEGAHLPGATVTVIDDATNQTQTATTGADGGYRFSMLAPGTYAVQFRSAGFKTARMASVVVSVSEAPTLDAALEPGEPAEQVACDCHISVVTSSTGTLVDAKT